MTTANNRTDARFHVLNSGGDTVAEYDYYGVAEAVADAFQAGGGGDYTVFGPAAPGATHADADGCAVLYDASCGTILETPGGPDA